MSDIVERIETFLSRGSRATIDWGAPRHPADLEDQADGKGPYIARWDVRALGDPPTEADGFTAHELHRLRS